MKIISLRQNPVQDIIELNLQSPSKQVASVEIYDALGVKLFSDTKNLSEGDNEIPLDTKLLSNGVYIVRINSTYGTASQCFVKIK